jgi:hypothetical protein
MGSRVGGTIDAFFLDRHGGDAMRPRNMGWPWLVLGALACEGPASAQPAHVAAPDVAYDDDGGPPDYEFDAEPGLVEVEPGIAVVPDLDEEVFFVDGWYWCFWNARWFHAGSWRGGWTAASPSPQLAKLRHGRFVHWHDGPVIRQGHGMIHHAPIAPRSARRRLPVGGSHPR